MEVTNDIKTIVGDILERYKQAVKDSGHYASGNLVKNARYLTAFDGRYFEITFVLEDYWKYLENGTRPHFPPVDKIQEWIRVKRVVPKAVNGRIPTTKQLAFLIGREISKNGTQPTKLLQKTIDGCDDLLEKMIDIITSQLEEEINEEINDLAQ